MIFEKLGEYGTYKIHFCNDQQAGLKAIVAIHSDTLGPATGGTRFVNYESEEAALFDVLRLSKGMTFKNACSGLKRGGAKGVIIGDTHEFTGERRERLMLAYGRFVESLGGQITTGQDMNISKADVKIMAKNTKHVVGMGDRGTGPFTARGVFRGLEAGAEAKFGSKCFEGKTVAVQGLGNVGYDLCKWLHESGAKLIVADINADAVSRAKAEFGAQVCCPEEILFVECDVLSPNARGAIFTAQNVERLKCGLVGGGANNMLVDDNAGEKLHQRGILYIPDYVINAGGAIFVDLEIDGIHDDDIANKKMDGVFANVKNVLDFARNEGIPSYLAGDRYAENLLANFKYCEPH